MLRDRLNFKSSAQSLGALRDEALSYSQRRRRLNQERRARARKEGRRSRTKGNRQLL